MARINTYERDTSVSGLDLLVGSEFYLDSGVPKYRTKNYSVNDLSTFFGLNAGNINSRLSTYLGVLNEDGSFTYSTAFANQTLTTVATAGYASASFVTNLGAIVGTLNADGTLISFSQALADQTLSTVASVGYAAATDVTALSATVVTNKSSADASFTSVNQSIATETSARSSAVTTLTATVTNNKTTTDASAVTLTQAVADETSARASAVTSLNSSISIKPNIFRQTSVPTALSAKDVWFDTDDGNRMYVSTSVGDNQVTSGEWEETTDTRLANVVTSAATATTNISTLTTADTAKAAQITELNAQFTFSGGNITGVADALNTSINTAVSNGTSAISTSVDELKTQFTFSGNNITGVSDALNTSINTAASDAVSSTASSLDKLEALFQFDGSGNVNGLTGSTTISSAIATSETNAVSTADTARANAQTALVATISKVFRQNDPPAVTEPVNSIWYDTNDSNKSYVLVAGSPRVWTYTVDATLATSASVQQVSDTAADINGNLSASHSLMVNAGGAIAGMKVSASTNDSGVSNSNVVFQADQFTIKTSSGTAQPFSVSGNVVTINGSLKIGNTDASAIETKANGANQDATTTILTSASTASNTQDKDAGSVGGWTLDSNYIYSGTLQTSDGYSASGITLWSGGALRAKEFYIANNGDAFFKGDISAASGTFTGGLSGATISGGTITIGAATDYVFKASAAGIQLGNTNFASAEFSVTPGGVLKAISGTIGGWTLGSTTLTSANDKVTLSSADSNLPNIEDSITGQPSGTYNGSTTAYNHFYSTSNGGVSVANNYVGLSSGSTVSETSNVNTADGWSGGYPWSSISFVANSSSAGKPVTITVNVSNSNSHAYLSKIVTSGSTNSYSFSGSYQVKIVMGIYKANSGTIASTTRIFGGTSPEEDSSGNLLIGLPDNYLMSVNLSSTTLVSGHTYYIRTGIQWVYIAGTFGTTSITGYRVYFATPRSSGGAIIYAVGRTEVIGGGLQVIKGSDAFLSLNRSQNTATNPFILSRGYSKHQGDLYIDGALDAASKNFKIKHPLSSKSSTHYLIHSSIESPRADLIYRGKVKIFNEVTVVNIDEESNMTSGTFEVLCRNVQCFTTNETSWGAIKARVEGNLLIITAKEVGSFDTISWMVVGERCDADIYMSNNTDVNGKLIVELEK